MVAMTMEESSKSLRDYWSIFYRWKYVVLATFLLILAASIAMALLLPATYKSEGIILIESQEIPENLVETTVTSYAAQRIEIIRQRIMTTQKIMTIVNKYDLFADQRQNVSPSVLVRIFSKNIDVEMIEANVTDPNSGQTKKATIAFNVSYTDGSPQVAQQVANELVSEFLSENVRTRTERAAETLTFLRDEADKFEAKVKALEKKIAVFKDENRDSLPELLEFNLERVSNLQEELASHNSQALMLTDQIATLSSDLVQIDPQLPAPRVAGNQTALLTPAQELQQRKRELANMKAKYSDSHPDVVRLEKQITNLTVQAGESAATPGAEKTALGNERQMNPVYLQIKSKIDSSEREVARLQEAQAAIKQRLADYEQRVYKTHQVSRAYDDLTRDHENNMAKYSELRAKQLQAELAQNLEIENKGETFTLIEPPLVPTKAESPNRPKIIAAGILASTGGGLGMAMLLEMLFGGVRGYPAISQLTGTSPLVVIGNIQTQADTSANRRRILWVLGLTLLSIILLLLAVHIWLMDLEVLWFKVLAKLTAMMP